MRSWRPFHRPNLSQTLSERLGGLECQQLHAKETLMRIIGVQRRVSPFLIAAALLLQLSSGLAAGELDAQRTTIHGSRPVEVTFTKWPTTGLPPLPTAPAGRTLFQGFVGGDLGDGGFVAEVLDSKVSTACAAVVPPCTPGITPPTISGSIGALQAIYEVQVGENSFTALVQGGRNRITGGVAFLDGVILAGWRTGARVHVAFDTLSNCTDRDGVAHGPCFVGTIRVGRVGDE